MIHGTKVTASCLQKFFERFEKLLIQDDCLFIHRPSLAENKLSFKFAEKEQKVTFFFNTLVTKCNSWSGSQHGFVFADFKSILDESGSNGKSIALGSILDVIGYVVICYPIEDTITKLGPGKRMTLKLRDLRNEDLTVTLLDEFAKEMNVYMSLKDKDMHVVLLIQFGVLKLYKGKQIVSNSFDATRLFINTDIADIKAFKKSYLENSSTGSSSTNHQFVQIKSVEDLFINDTEFSPIAYVPLIDEEKSVVIVGTFKSICTEKLWYYDACNVCKFKVQQKYITIEKEDGTCDVGDKKVFKCTNKSCNGKDIYPVYRFKIPIRVQDSTGTVSLTLFDHEAFKMIRKPAKDLVERQEKSSEFEEYPADFNDFIGKTFAFHIKISGYNLDEKKEYYGINKLTNDCAILSKLEKKIKNIDQHDETESIGASMSEVQSNITIGVKDMVSCTGDNTIPLSNEHEVVAKPSSLELKRNLEEIYDVEDVSGCSSTKTRAVDDSDEANAAGKFKLLVPNHEK